MSFSKAGQGVFAILLAGLSAMGQTPDVKTVLNSVAKATGADRVKSLQYSGSGSIYVPAGGETTPSVHKVLKRYSREMDLQSTSSKELITSVTDGSLMEENQTHVVAADSPWSDQYDFWLTPFGFLKGASSNDATAELRTVLGEPYTVVTFKVQNKYKVTGFINIKNELERVQAALDTSGEPEFEAIYHDYSDFAGVKFPTTIIQKQDGALRMILIVKEVKPNASVAGLSTR
jgi:hypothetical protein